MSFSLVIVLHLESFNNNLFELDFSISKKTCFYGKTFQEDEIFLHVYEIFFFEMLVSFHMSKHFWTLLKVSDPVFEKNATWVNNLKKSLFV